MTKVMHKKQESILWLWIAEYKGQGRPLGTRCCGCAASEMHVFQPPTFNLCSDLHCQSKSGNYPTLSEFPSSPSRDS